MKYNKLFILPLLGLILTGCNNTETKQDVPPVVIDDDDNKKDDDQGGGGQENPPVYTKDELASPIKLGDMLPIGNKVIDGPTNLSNPDEISPEKSYNFTSSMPTNWVYIMGNNKAPGNESFYKEGGLKFSHLWYGVQSCAFKPYKYTYVSFKVSSVNQCSDAASENPIFHVYGYDKDNNCILQKNIEQGSITVATKGNYVNFEIHNDQMVYLEMRLNANPCKGQQSYNFGISEIKIKGSN